MMIGQEKWTTGFLAGSCSGVCATFVGQPFDTLKVLMQTDKDKYPTVVKSLKYIYKNKGLRSLFQGATSPMLSSSFTTAISFLSYSKSLALCKSLFGKKESNQYINFLAGGMSGFVTSIVFCPFEVIKTKLQTQTNHSLYKGNFDCLQQILKKEGPKGIFKGLRVKLMMDSPGVGVYFATYEFMKKKFDFSPIISGGIAGIVGWVSIYPLDLVKTRLQSLPVYPNPGWDKYTGIKDCFVKTYKEGGVKLFWRGVEMCVIRAFPVNAVRFYVYERVLAYSKEREEL